SGALGLAKTRPTWFRPFARQLYDAIDYDTPRFVLYRGWTAAPKVFADDALAVLAADPGRLQCGYSENPYWVTHQLLEAASPCASRTVLRDLEQTILNYYPSWERHPEGRRDRGSVQWLLLHALPGRRLSKKARRRRAELDRKFGEDISATQPRG